MARGSVLKNLKTNLQKHDLLRDQSKKHKKVDVAAQKAKRERDQKNLAAIRDAFNPFDTKFNRQKSEIGRSKAGPMGAPTATKSIAEKQRLQVYEAQQKYKNKSGRLVDKRIGDKHREMSSEERRIEEYARQRAQRSRKSFNIEEDDFEENDLMLSDDGTAMPNFEAEVDTNIQNEFGTGEEVPERPKTKAEIMQEVIAKSKLHKYERQQQREQDDQLIDNLNADFDSLMADLQTVEGTSKKPVVKVDSYDKNVQELAFEKRADPKDRTKTDEELAAEAKEKREQAERAKLARMEGDDLDIPEEGEAHDDAELFGLHDSSDSENDNEIEDEGQDASAGYANVNVPTTLTDLKTSLSKSPVPKLKEYIAAATPGRGSGDKQKLHALAISMCEYMLTAPQHFSEILELLHDIAPNHEVGKALANHMRDLVHKVKHKKVWKSKEKLLFALIGSLFTTSDQWHVVATSAMLVMMQRLANTVEMSLENVQTCLYLCDMMLVYQRLSKRYIPEIPMFLLRFLGSCDPKAQRIAERYVRIAETEFKIEELDDKLSLNLSMSNTSAEQCLLACARLMVNSASMWRSLSAFSEIYSPLLAALKHVNSTNSVCLDAIQRTEKLVKFSVSERKFLKLQEFRPVGIITRMPLFDENYNPELKNPGMDRDRRELNKLKAQYKKERKSNLREIRRDAEFESRQKLSKRRSEMEAYHEKLKRLEGQINGEEGAARNAYERERTKRRKH